MAHNLNSILANRATAVKKAAAPILRRYGLADLGALADLEVETFDAKDFVEQMVIRRLVRGITARELAERAGYEFTLFSRWERGVIPGVKLATAKDWAGALGFDLQFRTVARDSA